MKTMVTKFFKRIGAVVQVLSLAAVLAVLFSGSIAFADRTFSLPDQTGHSGQFLQTNGSSPLWATAGGSGGLTSVAHDGTLSGDGTVGDPLSVIGLTGTPTQILYYDSATGVVTSDVDHTIDNGSGGDTSLLARDGTNTSAGLILTPTNASLAYTDFVGNQSGQIQTNPGYSILKYEVGGNVYGVQANSQSAGYESGLILGNNNTPLFKIINAGNEWEWPTTDGTNGQALVTNGSGVLSFANTGLSSVSVTGSIVGNGTSGSPLQLNGDNATPGNSFYYGTNSSGTNGFFALPVTPQLIGATAGIVTGSTPGSSSETWLGRFAGASGSSTVQNVFLGYGAGQNAGSARNSQFIGFTAGQNATNANDSAFLGDQAGNTATNASNSIFIGDQSGFHDTVDNTGGTHSILIGANTLTGGFTDSIALGTGATNTSSNQIAWSSDYTTMLLPLNGASAGDVLTNDGSGNATWQPVGTAGGNFLIGQTSGIISNPAAGSSDETWLGEQAGASGGSTSQTVFIGNSAGSGATSAATSTFVGVAAGSGATSATSSTFLGSGAGAGATNASGSIFIGNTAGENDTVDNTTNGGSSILIGVGTLTGGFSNSIAIGNNAINTATNQFMIGTNASSLVNITSIVAPGYPSTRDDSGTTTPTNFLYTDTDGQFLSAPLSAIPKPSLTSTQVAYGDASNLMTSDANFTRDPSSNFNTLIAADDGAGKNSTLQIREDSIIFDNSSVLGVVGDYDANLTMDQSDFRMSWLDNASGNGSRISGDMNSGLQIQYVNGGTGIVTRMEVQDQTIDANYNNTSLLHLDWSGATEAVLGTLGSTRFQVSPGSLDAGIFNNTQQGVYVDFSVGLPDSFLGDRNTSTYIESNGNTQRNKISGSQNVTVRIVTTDMNDSIVPGDYQVDLNPATTSVTETLPATPVQGDVYIVKDKQQSILNTVTIDGNGNDIDGSPTQVLGSTTEEQSETMTFNGIEWDIN